MEMIVSSPESLADLLEATGSLALERAGRSGVSSSRASSSISLRPLSRQAGRSLPAGTVSGASWHWPIRWERSLRLLSPTFGLPFKSPVALTGGADGARIFYLGRLIGLTRRQSRSRLAKSLYSSYLCNLSRGRHGIVRVRTSAHGNAKTHRAQMSNLRLAGRIKLGCLSHLHCSSSLGS